MIRCSRCPLYRPTVADLFVRVHGFRRNSHYAFCLRCYELDTSAEGDLTMSHLHYETVPKSEYMLAKLGDAL